MNLLSYQEHWKLLKWGFYSLGLANTFINTFKTTNIPLSNESNPRIYSKFIEINFWFRFLDILKNTNLASYRENKKIFNMHNTFLQIQCFHLTQIAPIFDNIWGGSTLPPCPQLPTAPLSFQWLIFLVSF